MTEINEETLEKSQAVNHLLLEMVKAQKESNRSLVKVFIAAIICYTMLLTVGLIGFFWYESQFEVEEQARTITEETITQEVSGENSEINNVQGNLYKDNATHNDNSTRNENSKEDVNNARETDNNENNDDNRNEN